MVDAFQVESRHSVLWIERIPALPLANVDSREEDPKDDDPSQEQREDLQWANRAIVD